MLDDPRLIQVEELVNTAASILPPINANSGTLGKASGALIK